PVTEFITRANYGMIIGNFEFDFTSGEIRYKTSIDVEGENLSFALIKQVVCANVTVMDEYLPSLIAVIEGKAGVREALTQIEV
ncbi:MAG: YbjN domain-containing protein, partial [Mastigocoleus sp. MO_167.B18]|nr:YbjN domain-containing protein [Mastigocoleus sp. MO_167.B18]